MPDNQASPRLDFPKRFLWGAGVSAHQVEGGNHNQWSVWELENAKSLATQAPYHYSDLDNWQDIKRLAKTPANYVSGKAVNHQHLFANDFDLLKQLHMNAFRFSLEWSRLEPEEGAWSVEAVEYYKNYFAELKKRDIEPIVTLFHFTLPVWFALKGGFEKRSNIKYFEKFTQRVLDTFGAEFKYVITINEPEAYAFESYHLGHWPPQKTKKLTAVRVYKNLAVAHNGVAKLIHQKNRKYKVSIAKHVSLIYPGDDSKLSVWSASTMSWWATDYWLNKAMKNCDFIGVNYYASQRIYGYRMHNPDERVSDMGWDMQPSHIQHVLEFLSEKYKKPIMITENGLADAEDKDRKWWLQQTILGLQRAMKNGVELIGYIHWSLLDNFEWDKGRWPRFGLAAVDYRTMKRTLRPSANWFADVIKKIRG